MYTQEIICPHCGKLTRVNIADTEGSTTTPCQRFMCKREIVVRTDKTGNVISVQKGGCFLTSASIYAAGLSDDCYELETLRSFRDGFVQNLPNGPEIISNYYTTAPKIAHEISISPSANSEYKKILETIKTAVSCIEALNNEKALDIYVNMFEELKCRYLRPNI